MTALVFLVQTVFGFFILAVLLRFLLQCVRADFYNPLVQFLVRITNPLLAPLRRTVPGYRGFDLAAIVLAILLQASELLLITIITGRDVGVAGFLLAVLSELLRLLLSIYLWGIVLLSLMSWINPDLYRPMARILGQLTAPLLRPARRLLPPISGIDLSPMIAIAALIFLQLLLEDTFRVLAGLTIAP